MANASRCLLLLVGGPLLSYFPTFAGIIVSSAPDSSVMVPIRVKDGMFACCLTLVLLHVAVVLSLVCVCACACACACVCVCVCGIDGD